MAGKFNYLEEAWLNYVFRGAAAPTLAASVYIALFTTLPGEDGTGGVEVSGGSYARQAVTRGTGQWKDPATATQGHTNNTGAITFPTATAPWGTVLGVGVYDASTVGNGLYFGALAVNKVIGTNDIAKFNANDLDFLED